MNEHRTDHDLIAAANQGDAAAFDALYQRYRDWVIALALRFTGDRDLALDVTQDTFLYVLGKFPGFVLTARFKTFLYPVVRNLSITARGRSRRFANPATRGNDDSGADLFAQLPAPAETSSDLSDLAAVLAELSDDHRETVLLRFVEDLSLEEVAQAMDVPLGTVKSRLHHALGRLRRDPRIKKYFEQ